jgi:hypothetical protein
MGWGPALCFTFAGLLFAGILYVAATDPLRIERRQIKRYRKQRRKIRATWRELNRMAPGAFKMRTFKDWSSR